jgi:hypothetical protein
LRKKEAQQQGLPGFKSNQSMTHNRVSVAAALQFNQVQLKGEAPTNG